MRWKVYYDDGRVFDDSQVAELPRHGVVCIAHVERRIGRKILADFGFYYRKGDHWYGADQFGLIDQVMHFVGEITNVLAGRMVSDEQYQEILSRAYKEDGLPRASGRNRKSEVKGRISGRTS